MILFEVNVMYNNIAEGLSGLLSFGYQDKEVRKKKKK